jgi:hypothetical protein
MLIHIIDTQFGINTKFPNGVWRKKQGIFLNPKYIKPVFYYSFGSCFLNARIVGGKAVGGNDTSREPVSDIEVCSSELILK